MQSSTVQPPAMQPPAVQYLAVQPPAVQIVQTQDAQPSGGQAPAPKPRPHLAPVPRPVKSLAATAAASLEESAAAASAAAALMAASRPVALPMRRQASPPFPPPPLVSPPSLQLPSQERTPGAEALPSEPHLLPTRITAIVSPAQSPIKCKKAPRHEDNDESFLTEPEEEEALRPRNSVDYYYQGHCLTYGASDVLINLLSEDALPMVEDLLTLMAPPPVPPRLALPNVLLQQHADDVPSVGRPSPPAPPWPQLPPLSLEGVAHAKMESMGRRGTPSPGAANTPYGRASLAYSASDNTCDDSSSSSYSPLHSYAYGPGGTVPVSPVSPLMCTPRDFACAAAATAAVVRAASLAAVAAAHDTSEGATEVRICQMAEPETTLLMGMSVGAVWKQRYEDEMGYSPTTAQQLCNFARNRGGQVTWQEIRDAIE